MIFITKLKRRYADMRWGFAQVSVIIGLTNFLLISYNFTNAKELVSFPIFILLTVFGFIASLIVIGKIFRDKQMGVDHDLGFENAPLNAKTYRIIIEQLPQTKESIEFVKYLKKIEDKQL